MKTVLKVALSIVLGVAIALGIHYVKDDIAKAYASEQVRAEHRAITDKKDELCLALEYLAFEQTGYLQRKLNLAYWGWYIEGYVEDKDAFFARGDEYVERMNTATALLHMDRCKHRLYEIHALRDALKDVPEQ